MKSRLILGCLLALLMMLLLEGATPNTGADVPDSLHVVRTEQFSEYHVAPFNLVIHNAGQVHELYKAMYALKPVPPGVSSCPSDIGLIYHLGFFHGDVFIQHIDFDPLGCEFLSIDTQDARITTPAFRALLAQILHLSSLIPPGVLPGSHQISG